jgi:hypothetical protein
VFFTGTWFWRGSHELLFFFFYRNFSQEFLRDRNFCIYSGFLWNPEDSSGFLFPPKTAGSGQRLKKALDVDVDDDDDDDDNNDDDDNYDDDDDDDDDDNDDDNDDDEDDNDDDVAVGGVGGRPPREVVVVVG